MRMLIEEKTVCLKNQKAKLISRSCLPSVYLGLLNSRDSSTRFLSMPTLLSNHVMVISRSTKRTLEVVQYSKNLFALFPLDIICCVGEPV